MKDLTQTLVLATLALIAHVVAALDREATNPLFAESLVLAAPRALLALAGGPGLAAPPMRAAGANTAMVAAGTTHRLWFVSGPVFKFAA
jgi:hypothetical protein